MARETARGGSMLERATAALRQAPAPKRPRRPADPGALLVAVREVVYDWDLTDDAIAWGPSAAETLGSRDAAALVTGAAFSDAVETTDDLDARFAGRDAGTGIAYRLRYHLRLIDGRRLAVEDTGRWFAGPDGRPVLAHGVLRLEPAAPADPGARDPRARLLDGLRDPVTEAARARRAATLLVFAPDEPLDEAALDDLAVRVRPVMRRRERAVRYGDRLAVLLASCPADQAELAAARLVAAASPVPIRVGAACVPEHALDAATLLRRAEDALARARAGATRRVVLHDPAVSPTPAEPRARASALDLLDALNDRRVVLVHQPVVEAGSRQPVFAEALMRLVRPDGGLVAAREILPAAERAGLMPLLDARVLDLAADHLAARPHERLSINVATATLAAPDWLSTLAAHLGARPGIAARLVLEVREDAVAGGVPRSRFEAMKALGIGLAVDGFGTGGATLAHLAGMPVDLLKIDGAFVQTVNRSPDDRLVVRGLVDLAHHLGVTTVAEWVEDEATAALLAGWGVDYLQGEHIGPPERVREGAPLRAARA